MDLVKRFLVITNGKGSYEMWDSDIEAAEERFKKEFPEYKFKVFFAGQVPEGTTMFDWDAARVIAQSDREAQSILWVWDGQGYA